MQLVLLFCVLFSAFNCIVDYAAVKQDVIALFTKSQDFWPADYGNYGPFFIRQAWHCAGSYRKSDGRGGCDGGRQRFEPELSWDDNTNLDKAKRLLLPIKLKYGEELSWGDLIVLTGTYAIESMGGPVLGFCGGRIDSPDGKESQLLGPTWIQNKTYPCKENGACKSPLGATTLGLIYVNPEGPMGNPDPYLSSFDIRDTFGRMDMSDWETVALIGGGHAFGKTHGACPLGPGPSPKQDPGNPWPGKCGTGKGKDTFTSGFEGPWTTKPTRWTNDYFSQLINYNWSRYIGPGGHNQWKAINGPSSVMALTSDVALTKDSVYRKIVQEFANNISTLDFYFKNAWYKLMSRDMGPVTRCVGPWVPPAQPFQFPLPPPPRVLPNYDIVKIMLKSVLTTPNKLIKPDYDGRGPNYYGVYIHLAHQAATTFRHTDYLGGINGARIRFSPQSQWPTNKGIDEALQVLNPVKASFKDLSWADLIALAGTYSLELSVNLTNGLTFCGGRTDAGDGLGSSLLSPNGNYSWTLDEMKLRMELNDLSNREYVALSGRYRSDEQMSQLGFYTPSWVNPTLRSFSNEYFTILLSETWELYANNNFNPQYKAKGKNIFMTQVDMNLLWDPALLAIVQDFASNKDIFLLEFTFAWTKLMNNDRFQGPDGNVCD